MDEKNYTWDLSHLLEGKKTEQLLDEINNKVESIVSYRSQLKESIDAGTVKDILKTKEQLKIQFSKLYGYYGMMQAADTDSEEALAKMGYLKQLDSEIDNKTIFFSLWFMHLDDKNAERIMRDNEVQEYTFLLQNIRKQKPHTRNEEEEKIISLKNVTGSAFENIYDVFTNSFRFDFNGKKGVSQEEVVSHFTSKDPALRKEAYDVVYGKFGENSTVISEIYKNIVLDYYNEIVQIRNYESPISARNFSNKIDDETVSVMLSTIRKNISLFSEYFKVKHEILQKNNQKFEFSRYHIYAPFDSGVEKEYSYEESINMVLQTYKEFDERFFDAAKKIIDEKHIHSHPKEKKRSGAFCWSPSNKDIPYILLNHTNKLRDVSTMQHEFGHGIHDIFASKQNNFYAHPVIPMAETASVFGEMLLMRKLLENSENPKEKAALLISSLNDAYATIGRQATFTYFEQWAHENMKKGPTKKEIDDYYTSLLKEQFGEMEIPSVFKHEWNYIPHIHASPFYCYGYAWGNLMVLSLYAMYKEEGKPFVDKYINLLSAGASKPTTQILKDAGINPDSEEFWQKGFDVLRKEIAELKEVSRQL